MFNQGHELHTQNHQNQTFWQNEYRMSSRLSSNLLSGQQFMF